MPLFFLARHKSGVPLSNFARVFPWTIVARVWVYVVLYYRALSWFALYGLMLLFKVPLQLVRALRDVLSGENYREDHGTK